MSELRFNPITKKWSVIASERGQKRNIFIAGKVSADTPCPFCDKDGGINKKLRRICSVNLEGSDYPAMIVTPNRYPALGIEGDINRKGFGIYDSSAAIGAHEVVIDSYRHGIDISGYTEDELNNLFTAFKWRICDLEKDIRFRHIAAFKNIGEAAGEIINHPHAQIIAFPFIAENVERSVETADRYYKEKERCIYCDMLEQELRDRKRVIFENYEFAAFAPYASLSPFEISVFPKKHASCFRSASEGVIRQLADITKEIFGRLSSLLGAPAVTMALRIPPFKDNRPDFKGFMSNIENSFHWHLEIRPVIAKASINTWAANVHINPVKPEDAAKYLREVNPI